MKKLGCCVQGHGQDSCVQGHGHSKSFTSKLGMVMHRHEPKCLSKRLVCCLQGQGHSDRSCNQNMSF